MAIEPLNSAITYNVQQTQTSATVQRANETMEGQSFEAATPRLDEVTLSVARSQASDENGGERGEGQNGGLDQEFLKKAFEEINKKSANFESEFGIHEKTNRMTVKIVDKKTKKVIKELPPEKMLDMIAKVWEMAGLIVDEKR